MKNQFCQHRDKDLGHDLCFARLGTTSPSLQQLKMVATFYIARIQ